MIFIVFAKYVKCPYTTTHTLNSIRFGLCSVNGGCCFIGIIHDPACLILITFWLHDRMPNSDSFQICDIFEHCNKWFQLRLHSFEHKKNHHNKSWAFRDFIRVFVIDIRIFAKRSMQIRYAQGLLRDSDGNFRRIWNTLDFVQFCNSYRNTITSTSTWTFYCIEQCRSNAICHTNKWTNHILRKIGFLSAFYAGSKHCIGWFNRRDCSIWRAMVLRHVQNGHYSVNAGKIWFVWNFQSVATA